MKYFFLLLLFFFSITAFAGGDSCHIIQAWKTQPVVPLPTLDHHVGKITASIGLFSVMSVAGVDKGTSALIASSFGLTFELIQCLFFGETLQHSVNDVILYSFHLPVYLALDKKYVGSVVVTVNLTAIYLSLL